jgi:hypothetical protein
MYKAGNMGETDATVKQTRDASLEALLDIKLSEIICWKTRKNAQKNCDGLVIGAGVARDIGGIRIRFSCRLFFIGRWVEGEVPNRGKCPAVAISGDHSEFCDVHVLELAARF